MRLHEYQAKQRFARYQIPTPAGHVVTSPQDAYAVAAALAQPVVLKAQVLTGRGGRGSGVKAAFNAAEAQNHAAEMLGMKIKGVIVRKLLIEPVIKSVASIYLGITCDRNVSRLAIMASNAPIADIEASAHLQPSTIIREYIHPFSGLHNYQVRNLANGLNLPREHWDDFTRIAQRLYRCGIESDATLAEIDPLALTPDGRLLALSSRLVIDDNALARQPELRAMHDSDAELRALAQARAAEISYIKLSGQIGCIVNGAGLAMTTMDMITTYGDGTVGPANFLDIGGGAQADKVTAGLHIILADPDVKVILLNIFGGTTRGDEVARGILQALDEIRGEGPLVIRLMGTHAEEGRTLLESACPNDLHVVTTLNEATQLAIAIALGTL
ncbi:MAG: ADP-forming succinate--CoA ligase subunit beta [Chloroflexi bacterium]|nr:ADP-forming succinate--CoA ligase subunit beta [Chloroflexota bacterium]